MRLTALLRRFADWCSNKPRLRVHFDGPFMFSCGRRLKWECKSRAGAQYGTTPEAAYLMWALYCGGRSRRARYL